MGSHGRLVFQGLGGIANPTHPTIPAPGEIRNDEHIQHQVQERLKQLSENLSQGNDKIKSQRGGAVDVYVNTRVKWPHEFALTGTKKKRSLMTNCPQFSGWLGFARP